MWEVKCTACEEVDMTCFASFRAQTVAEVLCHVFFLRHFADDTGLMHFSVFSLCRWHGSLLFFLGYARLLPCHLQVLYVLLIFSSASFSGVFVSRVSGISFSGIDLVSSILLRFFYHETFQPMRFQAYPLGFELGSWQVSFSLRP